MAERRDRIWRLFILGRSVVAAAFLAGVVALYGAVPPDSLEPLYFFAGIQLLTNTAYFYLWRIRSVALLGYLVFCVEILLITLLIYLLGAEGRIFVLAYLWPIIMGGWLLGHRAIPKLTLLSGLCFTLLIMLGGVGVRYWQRVGSSYAQPQALLLAYPYLAFVSLLVWLVTRETERSQADVVQRNAELQRERNLLRGILAHMSECVFVVDTERTVLLANQAAISLLGIRQGERLPAWLTLPACGQPEQDVGGRYRLEHEGRIISLGIGGMSDDVQSPRRSLYVAMDVTEQAQVERIKSDFVAYASHELRTPLTTIKTMARLLLMDADPDDKPREYLEVIDTQVDRQTRLINNLLDFTKLEAGHYGLNLEAVDPRLVVEASLSVCRPLADEKGIALEVSLEEVPASLTSSATGIEQVLINLLTNAIKFTGPGGRVDLVCRAEQNDIVFQVRDNGIGMSPQQVQHLFVKFHTARPQKRSGDGTGLGLVISKMIVEELGGTITVRSQEGVGTVFTVRLPLTLADVPSDVPTPEQWIPL